MTTGDDIILQRLRLQWFTWIWRYISFITYLLSYLIVCVQPRHNADRHTGASPFRQRWTVIAENKCIYMEN